MKECVDELVGDNLVDFDKIGSSNFFWAFPSKGLKKRSVKIEKTQQELHDETARVDMLMCKRAEVAEARPETGERRGLVIGVILCLLLLWLSSGDRLSDSPAVFVR